MKIIESLQLDPKSLTEWYAEYADRLRAFVYGLLRNWALTEDIVQAVFEKALTCGGEVRPGSETAWLFQVAFTEAMNTRRREEINQRSFAKLCRSDREIHPPFERLLEREVLEQMRQALENLPPEQKKVVTERIYEERTFQEIADRSRVPLGTVLTRMRLAIQKLRDALQVDE